MGAFVASTQGVCQWLMNSGSGYIYSTAPSPMVLGAVDAALDLLPTPELEQTRQHVAALAAQLRASMAEVGLETGPSSTQIVPIIVGSEQTALQAAHAMEQAGFLTVAIRPPTVPPGSCRLRVVVHGFHTQAHIEALAKALTRLVRPGGGAA